MIFFTPKISPPNVFQNFTTQRFSKFHPEKFTPKISPCHPPPPESHTEAVGVSRWPAAGVEFACSFGNYYLEADSELRRDTMLSAPENTPIQTARNRRNNRANLGSIRAVRAVPENIRLSYFLTNENSSAKFHRHRYHDEVPRKISKAAMLHMYTKQIITIQIAVHAQASKFRPCKMLKLKKVTRPARHARHRR